MAPNPDRGWVVLLIGGSSAAGKTHLADRLMREFAVPTLQIDDIRLALQQVTTRATNPDLFALDPPPGRSLADHASAGPEKERVARYSRVARAVWPGLRIVIESHLANAAPVIIEGDGLLPRSLEAFRNEPRLRALFLVDSEARLLERQSARGQRGLATDATHAIFARLAQRFGQVVAAEARALGYPVIAASPIESLAARVLRLLAGG